jgi:RNA polymerase sigma-70 factor (ECF subfamily)
MVVNRAISTGVDERQHVPVEDGELEHESGRFSQDGWWVVPPAHWADEAVERLSAPDVVARIHRVIEDLPAAQRQVVTLQDVEGLSGVEVCGVLGISDGNRRVLLHRARARIRGHLEREALL